MSNDDDKFRQALTAADPTFEARRSASEERERRFNEESAPVLADLAAAGVKVGHLRDLRRPTAPLHEAIPVLVRWLPLLEYMPVKRDVIRTLGEAKAGHEAAKALLSEYRRVDPSNDADVTTGVRTAIASALATGATDRVADELIELATDRRHGRHRVFAVLALGNMKKQRERAVSTLLGLLDDEDVADGAIKALVKLRATEARERVAAMREHASPAVRQEVRAALKRL